MMMDTSRLPLSKGKTRKQIKAKQDRLERATIIVVRAKVMERERHDCRLWPFPIAQSLFGSCSGPLEWSHWGPYQRWNTRHQDADQRHCTRGSMAICKGHHDAMDGRSLPRLYADALTARECDGPMRWSNTYGAWEEPAA